MHGYRTKKYVYGNKGYSLTEICKANVSERNITGYRKQGDYIQIRWKETSEGKNVPYAAAAEKDIYSIHHDIFLLDGELKPLPGCEVKFQSEYIEVE